MTRIITYHLTGEATPTTAFHTAGSVDERLLAVFATNTGVVTRDFTLQIDRNGTVTDILSAVAVAQNDTLDNSFSAFLLQQVAGTGRVMVGDKLLQGGSTDFRVHVMIEVMDEEVTR